jgi:hypothetical protein
MFVLYSTKTSFDTFTEVVRFVVKPIVALPVDVPPEQLPSETATTVKFVADGGVIVRDAGLLWLVVITPSDHVRIHGAVPVSLQN